MEQLNIVGKRSGEGFVAHKARLVNALSRTQAHRLEILDFTIGRKGFLGYIRALGGSNIVKIVPATNGSASASQAAAKRLKVVCGAHTSYLEDKAWISDKTPLYFAEVRISPDNSVKPNIGSTELAEALDRVLPFAATDDGRPVLQCVLFKASEGKLQLISSDGFRLAKVTLDYDDGEGQALVYSSDLKGIPSGLRKAKRARLFFEHSAETSEVSLCIDTEAICYAWRSAIYTSYPDYEKVTPTEFKATAHLDTVEAHKAIKALRVVADEPKDYPLDLHIGEGKIIIGIPDEKGAVTVPADTYGQGYVRISGKFLAQGLKACGGMADLKLVNSYSPIVLASEGYQMTIMPMLTARAEQDKERDRQAKAQAQAPAEAPAQAQAEPPAQAEAEVIAKAEEIVKAKKQKPSRKREPVTVA